MDNMNKLEKDGYEIIPSFLSNSLIDECINELYIKNKFYNKVVDGWKNIDIIGKIAFYKNIYRDLYEHKMVPIKTFNYYKSLSQDLHVEQILLCSENEEKNTFGLLWIAFEDITMENGPLIFYPGSHKFPFYNMQDLDLKPNKYEDYCEKIKQIIQKSNIKPEYGLIKKGDALLLHPNLIYGELEQTYTKLTRKSMLIYYFSKFSKFWIPLISVHKTLKLLNYCNGAFRNPQQPPLSLSHQEFVHIQGSSENLNENIIYANLKYNLYEKYDDFNLEIYRIANPDLNNLDNEKLLEHYKNKGEYENRRYNINLLYYRENNKDLNYMNDKELLFHFLANGCKEGRLHKFI